MLCEQIQIKRLKITWIGTATIEFSNFIATQKPYLKKKNSLFGGSGSSNCVWCHMIVSWILIKLRYVSMNVCISVRHVSATAPRICSSFIYNNTPLYLHLHTKRYFWFKICAEVVRLCSMRPTDTLWTEAIFIFILIFIIFHGI